MNFQTPTHKSTLPQGKVLAVTDFEVSLPVLIQEVSSSFSEGDYVATTTPDYKISDSCPAPNRYVNKFLVPAINTVKSVSEGAMATVIQIWEGVVTDVDKKNNIMAVKLKDRGGLIEDHNADISLQWVVDQDYDLVSPGAVFYWTIYKETKRGSISNAQEIRFRRLPSWTKSQMNHLKSDAEYIASKFSKNIQIAD